MTPDLPIPDQVLGEFARILWRHCPSMLTRQAEEATIDLLTAALPHLRSLQVETQVRAGYAIGRKEALDQVEPNHDALREELDRWTQRAVAARELGRREAQEECAAMLEERAAQFRGMWGSTTSATLLGMAKTLRSITSQPQNATSEPRTDLPVGPSHPKDSRTAREAPCPDCGLIDDHKGGCPQTGEAPRPGAPS